jgi:hypothetical protein
LREISHTCRRALIKTHLVELSDFPDEVHECLVDIDTLLSRRLDELAAKMLGQVTTLCM